VLACARPFAFPTTGSVQYPRTGAAIGHIRRNAAVPLQTRLLQRMRHLRGRVQHSSSKVVRFQAGISDERRRFQSSNPSL
jgi:hypothetical protein